jgi:hypothetical protein
MVPTRTRVLAVAASLYYVVASGAGPEPAVRPSTAGDCQNLLHQFDVAWPAHKDSVRADEARRSRDLGETDCRAGRFKDGVFQLRRALHDIGVKPVKIVATPARPQ